MKFVSLARSLGVEGQESGKEFRACCPLHNDSNPSFSLNRDTGQWVCFAGCGSGSFNGLVERVLNCSPQEARDFIVNNGQATSVEQISKDLGEALFPSVGEYTEHTGWKDYYDSLTDKIMAGWFIERGFTWKSIRKFLIRYDQLANSVTIPVFWDNQLVGTVTRRGEGLPKYVNSPKLPGSKILFGEINKAVSTIIIVEGILDAIWLWQNGHNGASILGSHLSIDQVNILREYRYGEIILALDNDEAGRAGTWEAVGKLTKSGWLLPQLSVVKFPDGIKDVQDCEPDLLGKVIQERKGIFGWS